VKRILYEGGRKFNTELQKTVDNRQWTLDNGQWTLVGQNDNLLSVYVRQFA